MPELFGSFNVIRTPLLAVVCVLAVLSGCNKSKPLAPSAIGDLPVGSFGRGWTARLPLNAKETIRDLHLRGDTVFAVTTANRSFLLARTGGQITQLHTVKASGPIRGPVVLKDRIVYPVSTTLEQFDLNGKPIPHLDLEAAIRSNAVGEGEAIYLGVDSPRGGRLMSIDPSRTYTPARWELLTFGGISSRPATFQSIVYAASEDGLIYAVNESRAAVWPLRNGVYRTGGKVTADVIADDFGVYVASYDTKLICLNRSTGKMKWQYFAGVALAATPAVTAETVYQFVPGQGVVAINKLEGEYSRAPLWTAPGTTHFLGEDATYAYLRTRDNYIVAVERTTGVSKFRSESAYDVFAANTTKDGVIYAARQDGTVFAINVIAKPGQVGQRAGINGFQPIAVALVVHGPMWSSKN